MMGLRGRRWHGSQPAGEALALAFAPALDPNPALVKTRPPARTPWCEDHGSTRAGTALPPGCGVCACGSKPKPASAVACKQPPSVPALVTTRPPARTPCCEDHGPTRAGTALPPDCGICACGSKPKPASAALASSLHSSRSGEDAAAGANATGAKITAQRAPEPRYFQIVGSALADQSQKPASRRLQRLPEYNSGFHQAPLPGPGP